MVSANDVNEATPSALTGGKAFTVTRDSSGTTAIAAPTPTAIATLPDASIPPGGEHPAPG